MENKKLLFIITELHWGGAQSVLLNICQYFSDLGYSNTVIYFNKDEIVNPLFYDYCDEILSCDQNNHFKEVIDTIHRVSPRIINTHIPVGRHRLYYELRKTKIPVIATVHTHSNLGNVSFIEKLKIWLFRHLVNKVVFVADFSKDYFVSHYFKSDKKCTTIHNGVTIPEHIDECSYSFSANKTHIISVANFRLLKGYQYAIPAFKELRAKFPNIQYHILGTAILTKPEEDASKWMKDYISENKLENDVILHGSQENVFPYLNSADIFLSASEQELLPMSILEAMNCSLPVVATDVGGVKEIIGKDNKYGILIEPMKIDKIVEGLSLLLNDSQKRYEMSKTAPSSVMDFTVEKMGQKYKELFENEF